jgi:hypothetical protein
MSPRNLYKFTAKDPPRNFVAPKNYFTYTDESTLSLIFYQYRDMASSGDKAYICRMTRDA